MSPVVVTWVGAATGARAAAAALACAASDPDRAALLIDFDAGRSLRSTLIATSGARALEERLVAHMPDAAIASRGRICQLSLRADPEAIDVVTAALPLARESAAVVHLPPSLLRPMLEHPRVQPTAALLRANLAEDRALAALAIRDLMARGLRVVVLKRPPSRLAGHAALLGALPAGTRALPAGLCERLLPTSDKRFHQCHDREDESQDDRQDPWTERSRP